MTALTRTFLAAALMAAPAMSVSSMAVPGDELLKPNEYDSIGKKLSNFVDARVKSSGIDKALEEVAKELEKVEKRIKRDPLSLPGEMGKALWASFDFDKKGSFAKGKVSGEDEPVYWDAKEKFRYAVWLPSKYDARKSYPLILCITDAGEKPTDHLTERWVDSDIRDNAILVAVPLPSKTESILEGITQSNETGMGNVAFLYSRAIRTYAIDFDRVYIAGHGRGVELALAYGASFPDRFAGIIGRSGDASPIVAENLRNLPTYFAGAGAKAVELADKLKALGYDNATIQAEGKESDVWSWMQGHARISNPTEVVLYVGSPVPNRAYWLEVSPSDGQGTPNLKARIDRATNTVHVEGEGVPKFKLFFNDTLLDLDKPVTVVANGTTNERTVPRSLQRTLDLMMNSRSDPGKFYVASMDFDLPPKPKEKK